MDKSLLVSFYLLVPALVLSTGIVQLKGRLSLMGKSSRKIAGRATTSLLSLGAGMAIALFIQAAPGIDWVNYLALVAQGMPGSWQ